MGGKKVSEKKIASLFLIRLIPALMLISLLAWCSSGNRIRNDNVQIAAELKDLFMQDGFIDGAGEVDLADVAKRIGEPGMNQLLYEAAPGASLDAVKWIVKHGADPKNIGAVQELTLLQRSAKTPRYERLEYFLSTGLDPLQRSQDGMTVLHIAARGGMDQRALSLLLSKGLKVTDVDATGRQPIHLASVKSISVLIAAGADVDAKDNEGRTALHLAARNGQNNVVTELLRQAASVFAQDNRGRTPLHLAAMNNNSDAVIDTLLAASAPKTARDIDGMTPKDIAQDARENNRSRLSTVDKL